MPSHLEEVTDADALLHLVDLSIPGAHFKLIRHEYFDR
jgi:50S ribosomal subunit-associated GTPase HflX